jgi:NADPH-dependent 2,4-dienoyl-CoA reductase/sulfur reductase-like enzyme
MLWKVSHLLEPKVKYDMLHEKSTDILIVGGSTGGVAGALAALRLGQRVILTEETDWIGGQLTSQGVPPDENPWIDKQGVGCTASYRQFRNGVRAYYSRNYPMLESVLSHESG